MARTPLAVNRRHACSPGILCAPSDCESGSSCSVATVPASITSVPDVTTNGLFELASACPMASIAVQSRFVIPAGSEKSPPKAMWMTPSVSRAPSASTSRSSSEPRSVFAPSSWRRTADRSERAKPVTVCPWAMSSEMMAGPVCPEPPVTKICMCSLHPEAKVPTMYDQCGPVQRIVACVQH